MPPFLGGGSMIDRGVARRFTPGRAAREVRSRHAADRARHRLGAAIDYLEPVGLDAIHRHEHELTRYAYERTRRRSTACGSSARRPSIERASSASRSSGIHAHDFAQVLDQHGIAVRAGHHCTQPLHERLGIAASTRASFYLYNTPAEVDRLVEGVLAVQRMFAPQGRQRKRRKPDE